jgi:hypothetical protein
MSTAYLANDPDNLIAAISTSYALDKTITLAVRATDGGTVPTIPQGCYWDHLELQLLATGTPTSVSAWLSWDSAGDHPATSEGTVTLVAALTTANTYGASLVINGWFRAPTVQTTPGTLYLHLKIAGTGTVTCNRARLVWTEDTL